MNPVYQICSKLCTTLVNYLFLTEEKMVSDTDKTTKNETYTKLVKCLTTLKIFCSACPSLLIPHANALQPYLKNERHEDATVIQNITAIIEQVVPLMDSPDPDFLAQLEADLTAPIHTQGMLVCSITSNLLSGY